MDAEGRRRPRGFRWWWALIVLASLGAAALSTYIVYAAGYQPLTSGAGMQVTQPVQQWTWQGLPAGAVQVVNTVGDVHHDLYAPPQRGWSPSTSSTATPARPA